MPEVLRTRSVVTQLLSLIKCITGTQHCFVQNRLFHGVFIEPSPTSLFVISTLLWSAVDDFVKHKLWWQSTKIIESNKPQEAMVYSDLEKLKTLFGIPLYLPATCKLVSHATERILLKLQHCYMPVHLLYWNCCSLIQ